MEKEESINLSAEENSLFMPIPEIKSKYTKRIMQLQSQKGKSSIDKTEISIGMIPYVVKAIGYPQGQMILPVSIASKAMGLNSIGRKAEHYVPFDVMKNLPDSLYDPVAIIDTGTRVKNGSEYNCLLFVSNLFAEGKPLTTAFVLIPFKEKGITNYQITSIYGHDVISQNGNRYFERCNEQNRFLYGISRELEFVELRKKKNNPLQGMNSRNDIENAPATRSVQLGTTPSRIVLPENVPTKTDVVKNYRLQHGLEITKKETRTR